MIQINYDAITKNALFFKKILGEAKLCAVLKNNAYGHGITQMAKALSGIADFIAVGTLNEALAVEPYCKHILILLPLLRKPEAKTAIEHGFSMMADSFSTLQTIRSAADECLTERVKIHIKIETGMNRLGFSEQDFDRLADEVNNDIFETEGIFSHFWGQTKTSRDEQTKRFRRAYDFLTSGICAEQKPVAHIANTAAALSDNAYMFDMARIGLGLYGYGDPRLSVAKTVTAKVIAVRDVKAGQTVGYGGEYTFPGDTRIAILNIGYANGFPRALAPANVGIGGKIFSTVGNICMAMCAVDIKNAHVNVGDEAILLGNGVYNGNSSVIVYELLCNLK